ncbi:MAG TPA: bifunctional 4-hydroxy-2-oxoglutarate aldolase/2-dehydro-3-deoxy-phosphogluconate aldolase [Terriglobales bacterium]|nr:bifunctional 4-hydroxy-2-oxoglutarate aldolase/2-dehydro-3-deoxy-phosphogluconate aldolase [Terriglobales bacterium]
MNREQILHQIHKIGLVPVLRAPSAQAAIAAAAAIEAGGVPVLEITMTVPDALAVIQAVVQSSEGRVLVGAGTVLDPETARACILAGAQFVVSPSLNVKTIELCRRYSVPVIPGALTPTEVVTAWEAGADVVKVFPCSAVGGAKYLAALRGPLPHIPLIPTGGVSLSTAADFLAVGAFALGVGSDLVDISALQDGKPEIITENARKYLTIVERARSA